MELNQWLYFGFTALLVAVFAAVTVYYFRKERKDKVESPKYRMLDDE